MLINYRNEINEIVESRKLSYTSISDSIWGFAESRFQEFQSSEIQQEYLRSQGFSIAHVYAVGCQILFEFGNVNDVEVENRSLLLLVSLMHFLPYNRRLI